MNYTIQLPDEAASNQFAAQLAQVVTSPLTLTFSGEIGAGKTTVIRGFLRELGVTSAIKSPTFSIVESYFIPPLLQIHHFDMYRIHDEDELELLGFRDYLTEQAVCCIEWPERVPQSLPGVDIRFSLTIQEQGREMTAQALSETGKHLLASLKGTS